MEITDFLALLGGTSVIALGISSWLGGRIAERVTSKWRRDEQAVLEAIRASNARSAALIEAGTRGFGTGVEASLPKRIAATEALWRQVLYLREHFGGVLFFYGLLLPDEYVEAIDKGNAMAASISDLDEASITQAMTATASLELHRPLLGETLWLRFFLYRAFLGRLAYLLVNGRMVRAIPDWRSDHAVRQYLRHALGQEAANDLVGSKSKPMGIYNALNALEALLLSEISQIVSGHRSSAESFENARELHKALADEPPSGAAPGRSK